MNIGTLGRGIFFLSVTFLGNIFFGSKVGIVDANDDTDETENIGKSGNAISITTDIFSDSSKDKIQPHFVMFYAPWCGHCKRLHPTWEALAEKYNKKDGSVVIGKVDCTEHQEICASQNINGYPTLKYLDGQKSTGIKYKGPRDLESLENFAQKQIDTSDDEDEEYEDTPPKAVNGLMELTDENFKETVNKGAHFIKFFAPWCVHCQRLATAWSELAKSFEHDKSVTISRVDCTKYNKFCTEFEVKGYPTLLWLEDGVKVAKYSGDRSHVDLKRFVTDNLGDNSAKAQSEKTGDDEQSLVVVLTSENFENAVEKGVTLVKYYAPWCGHCKRLAPIYNELGNKFLGIPSATIAKVDCTQDINKGLCSQEHIDGFPTLVLYRNGQRLKEYGGDRSLDDLVDFIYENLGHDEL